MARLNKEQRELEPVVMAYRAYPGRRQDLEDAEALMGDPDMKELAQEEVPAGQGGAGPAGGGDQGAASALGPNDDKSVIVEIRAGVGGRRRPCLPTPCSACTPCTPTPAAGTWRWTRSTRRSWAA